MHLNYNKSKQWWFDHAASTSLRNVITWKSMYLSPCLATLCHSIITKNYPLFLGLVFLNKLIAAQVVKISLRFMQLEDLLWSSHVSLVPNLTPVNPDHTLLSCLRSILLLASHSGLGPTSSLFFKTSQQNPVCSSFLSYLCYMSYHFILHN